MADTKLPKVSTEKKAPAIPDPEPNFFDRVHVKEIEAKNRQRVLKLLTSRRRSRITASVLSTLVLSIYGYTIYSMKQETFLDDFNEPEKIHD